MPYGSPMVLFGSAYSDELESLPPGWIYEIDKDGDTVQREDQIRHVKMCRLNGVEILDQTEWKGQWIPLSPCLARRCISRKSGIFSA